MKEFTESRKEHGSIGGDQEPYLGDEDEVAIGLADATTAIVANETEAGDAGGADLAVQTGSVGNPFQGLGANSTTIVHGFCSSITPQHEP